MIDYVCDKCNGAGFIEYENDKFKNIDKVLYPDLLSQSFILSCPLCKGSGKLNWIENVLGKNDTVFDKVSVFNTALTSEVALSLYRNF